MNRKVLVPKMKIRSMNMRLIAITVSKRKQVKVIATSECMHSVSIKIKKNGIDVPRDFNNYSVTNANLSRQLRKHDMT